MEQSSSTMRNSHNSTTPRRTIRNLATLAAASGVLSMIQSTTTTLAATTNVPANCFTVKNTGIMFDFEGYALLKDTAFNDTAGLDVFLMQHMDTNMDYKTGFRQFFNCPNWDGRMQRYHMTYYQGLLVYFAQNHGTTSCPPPSTTANKLICQQSCQLARTALSNILTNTTSCPGVDNGNRASTLTQYDQFCKLLPTQCGFPIFDDASVYCAPGGQGAGVGDGCCQNLTPFTGKPIVNNGGGGNGGTTATNGNGNGNGVSASPSVSMMATGDGMNNNNNNGTAQNQGNNNNNGNGNSRTIIIGVSILVVTAIIVVASLGFFYMTRRRRQAGGAGGSNNGSSNGMNNNNNIRRNPSFIPYPSTALQQGGPNSGNMTQMEKGLAGGAAGMGNMGNNGYNGNMGGVANGAAGGAGGKTASSFGFLGYSSDRTSQFQPNNNMNRNTMYTDVGTDASRQDSVMYAVGGAAAGAAGMGMGMGMARNMNNNNSMYGSEDQPDYTAPNGSRSTMMGMSSTGDDDDERAPMINGGVGGQEDYARAPSMMYMSEAGTATGGAAAGMFKMRVVYDYTAGMPDELSLEPGQLVTVTALFDDGWGHGIVNGARGAFPLACVAPLDGASETQEDPRGSIVSRRSSLYSTSTAAQNR
ncbi:hypothetical protein HDU76_013908 [Blyttiomyces sp. JEL0837]|nr:hypothetical protein HDU76_013908 [Blyttiomyces sp. JEL0837]